MPISTKSRAARPDLSARRSCPTTRWPSRPAATRSLPARPWPRSRTTRRAERGGYHRDDYQFEDGFYACKEHGIEEPIDDRERARYEGIYTGMDFDEIAVKRGVYKILLAQEKRIAQMVFNAGTFTPVEVSTPWSTLETATPIADVQDKSSDMKKLIGLRPNVLIISEEVFFNLTRCNDITSELVYTEPISKLPREAQKKILAEILKVDRILVAGAVEDSAKKGQAFSPSELWSPSYAMLARVSNGGMDLEEPCLGRTFRWSEDADGNPTVEQYREDPNRSDIYRVRHDVDECFVFTECATLLSNITSTGE